MGRHDTSANLQPPAVRPSVTSPAAFFLWAAIVATISLTWAVRSPAQAADDAAAATSHFERGARSYDLGRYAEAIASFERAYALDPAPILLFNIAQAYRRLGNAERAIHHYRRYLESAPATAPDRADAERRVGELERGSARSPAGASSAAAPAVVNQVAPEPSAPPAGAPAGGVSVKAPPPPAPAPADVATGTRRWRIGAEGGMAISRFRGADLEPAASFSARFGARALAGYRFGSEPTLLEVGAALSVVPISYLPDDSTDSRTCTLIGGAARIEVSHLLAPRFSVAAELLAGVVWWTGLTKGNPFTFEGMAASGPIPMPSMRLAIGLRYHVVPGSLFLYLQPALTLGKPLDE